MKVKVADYPLLKEHCLREGMLGSLPTHKQLDILRPSILMEKTGLCWEFELDRLGLGHTRHKGS